MTGAAHIDLAESWPQGCNAKQKYAIGTAGKPPAHPVGQTDDLCCEKMQLGNVPVRLEPEEYYTGFEDHAEQAGGLGPGAEWSLQSRCCPKDQSSFTLLGEDCKNGFAASKLQRLRLSVPDEPLAPASPRFSCQWDKVNREAYFNDLSSLDSGDFSPRYSYKHEEYVLFELESALDEDTVSVKLTVIHSYLQEDNYQDLCLAQKNRDTNTGGFNNFFRSIFPWCMHPRVEM